MSSKVQYKNNTLTTINNGGTKTLSTSGTYLEADIIITDTTANGSVTAPSSISGTAASISTGTGTLTLTKTISVTPNVTTAGYISNGTAGNSNVSLTANMTINPTPTASGATVTIPAGYYSEAASKSVTTTTHPAPTASVNNTTGLITASHTQGTGYVTGGTTTGTLQLSTVNGATITPTESEQIAVAINKFTLGAVKVAAIPSNYIGSSITVDPTPTVSGATVTIPTGYYSEQTTKSVSSLTLPTSTATSATNGYTNKATINPSTSDQYINIGTGYNGTASYYKINKMTTMILPTAAAASATSGYTSKATIGRSTSAQYINIPPGYNSAGGYYTISATPNGSVTAPTSISGSSASLTTGTNTITLSKTISVTPNVTTAGYISSGTAGNSSVSLTASVTTQAAKTVTPTKSSQTAVASGVYTTGAVTVAAIPTEYIVPTGDIEISSNGTVDVTEYATATVSINTVNNQNKTVTPTKSQQSVTADSGYTGLGTVTVNAIPAQYITTTDATATAAQILNTKTAYVNGSKVTGTMANNGATGGTITTQGGTYTIPAGYTTGGTVTASLTASSITNTAINGTSFEEETGDYGFRTTVTIPAGYYNATTLTKEFSTILPAPETEGTSGQVLIGYDLYNHEGQVISGTMANNGTWNQTLNDSTTSVTIPAGYHSGSGQVSHTTVAIPNPTISINSSGVITASGSWTKGFTTNASYSNTKAMTTKAAATITPTESEQTAVAANVYTLGAIKIGAISSTYVGSGITQRSSTDLTASGATVSVPAGYYAEAASKSVTTMTLPTSAASSATSGYTSKATIGRSTSAQYINIPPGYNSAGGYYTISAVPNGTVTAPSSISGSSASVSAGTNTLTFTKTISVTPNVTTAGYISSGTAGNASVSLTASVTTKAAATITPGTTNQTIAAGTYLTGAQTISGDADLVAANIKSGVSIFGVTGSYAGTTISNQNKEVDPSESEQSITFDSGYTGLGTVTVNPVSSTYVGSGITRRSSTDLTASGATVTVPAGYYASQASKAVSSMTLPTSAASSATSGYTSKATIGRSTSAQYINIPPGYNSAGAYYVISAVANGSVTAPSSISGTTATVSTGTNTLTLTKTVSVTPNVTTAGYISSGTAGNSSVSLTASVTTKAATTYNVSASNQTIAAGTYLTGAQTIRAVTHTATAAKIAAGQTVTIGDAGSATRIANISGTYTSDATAIASDILEGETAYVNGSKITGSLVINTIYTGSSTPSSSLGMNGDIYIQSTGM